MARYQALSGVEDVTRALGALRDDLRTGLRGVVRTATTRTHARAVQAVPVARVAGGTTRQAVRTTYFDDGDTGSVFVAPMVDPRTGRKRARNVPLWQEYGTRRADPHPYLTPAGRAEGRAMEREALRLVTATVAKAEG